LQEVAVRLVAVAVLADYLQVQVLLFFPELTR
jgi:hypothetical protein